MKNQNDFKKKYQNDYFHLPQFRHESFWQYLSPLNDCHAQYVHVGVSITGYPVHFFLKSVPVPVEPGPEILEPIPSRLYRFSYLWTRYWDWLGTGSKTSTWFPVNYWLMAFFLWIKIINITQTERSSSQQGSRCLGRAGRLAGGEGAEGQGHRRRGNWGRTLEAVVEQSSSVEGEIGKVKTGKLKLKLRFLDNINIYIL